MQLAGKVALVTGADSGIGEASAILFAREGARVAALDLTRENWRPTRPATSPARRCGSTAASR